MKYLIYGASGFLGGTLYQKLKESGHEVIGTYSTKRIKEEFIKVDLLDTDTALEIYRNERPDVIIWTIMNSNLEEVIAEQTLQSLMKEIKDCRFIFISTSVAYEPNMSEEVEPFIRTSDMYNPHYFNGKIKGEKYVASYDNHVIVRPGSIYGIDAHGNYDIRTKQLLNHIQEKEPYVRAKNICFSIVEVNELAEAIVELSQNDFVGIINISEEEPISHYDFNVGLCKKYQWDSSYVIGNYEEENIYYLNNELRKRVLKTKIGKRGYFMDNKELVTRFFDEGYTNKNYDFIIEYVSEEYYDHSPASARTNKDVVGILRSVAEQFSELKAEVVDIFAENNMVAARIYFEGIHTGVCMGISGSGKKISFEALEYFKVDNGKIVESWGYWPDKEIEQKLLG